MINSIGQSPSNETKSHFDETKGCPVEQDSERSYRSLDHGILSRNEVSTHARPEAVWSVRPKIVAIDTSQFDLLSVTEPKSRSRTSGFQQKALLQVIRVMIIENTKCRSYNLRLITLR